MTLTELTSIGTTIAVIGGGTLWLETRYVGQENVHLINQKIDALSAAVQLLSEDIPRRDDMTELKANIFTKEELMGDLEGRSLMYRALSQAGVITPEQQNRWEEVRTDISAMQREIDELRTNLSNLE